MKYILVKTGDCTMASCSYANVSIGSMISRYMGIHFPTTDINIVMKRATSFNNSEQPCKCKVEVKEVEE